MQHRRRRKGLLQKRQQEEKSRQVIVSGNQKKAGGIFLPAFFVTGITGELALNADFCRMKQFLLSHKWAVAATLAGGIGGYLYYSFVGCASGSCPITSNPWVSTLYGAGMGLVAGYKPVRKIEK